MSKQEIKPTTTHVLMVVDMSGSMSALAADVRGGFNEYVASLRADTEMDYRLTVTLFDTEFIPFEVDTPVGDVTEMTEKNYRPRGGTALNDAIGNTINTFDAKHGKVKKHERVLMVIQTDGYENSSREFQHHQVKALIAAKEQTGRWGFIFLGAGPDAWQQGNSYGLGSSTLRTAHTSAGTSATYSGLATASGTYSRGGTVAETFTVLAETEGVADPDVQP